jgi:hypothetical protein
MGAKTKAQGETNQAWRERNDLVQMNTAVPKKELTRFDTACRHAGVSRREQLRQMMTTFVNKTGVK